MSHAQMRTNSQHGGPRSVCPELRLCDGLLQVTSTYDRSGATLKLVLRVPSTNARHGQSEFARGTLEASSKSLSFAWPPCSVFSVQSPKI